MFNRPPQLDDRGLPAKYNFRPDVEITPRDLKARRDAGEDLTLVDCRTPKEHDVARIDGAVLLPLQQFQQAVEELEDEKDRPIVVFCHHGMRSLRMTLALRELGFTDVRSMAGGIDLWSLDIDPSVPRY